MRANWKLIVVLACVIAAGTALALDWREAFDRAVRMHGPNAPLLFVRDYAHAVDQLTTPPAQAKLATILRVLDMVSSYPADLRAIVPELTADERAVARSVALDWISAVYANRRAMLEQEEQELIDGLQ